MPKWQVLKITSEKKKNHRNMPSLKTYAVRWACRALSPLSKACLLPDAHLRFSLSSALCLLSFLIPLCLTWNLGTFFPLTTYSIPLVYSWRKCLPDNISTTDFTALTTKTESENLEKVFIIFGHCFGYFLVSATLKSNRTVCWLICLGTGPEPISCFRPK